ncbi:MAG: hypothetical protein QOE96_3513 [Blastocatellia bacterium]|jgi:hypothetical protein|nr:hypothetical protein [Blastocatellia bacterium]
MYLVQILLPLYDNQQTPFPRAEFDNVRAELTELFGGVTAFVRSPAVGLWKEGDERVTRDDVILFQVTIESVDRGWWSQYREALEKRFQQDEVLILATEVEKL